MKPMPRPVTKMRPMESVFTWLKKNRTRLGAEVFSGSRNRQPKFRRSPAAARACFGVAWLPRPGGLGATNGVGGPHSTANSVLCRSFLGNELAALGRTAEHAKQFKRAAALYPAAQSPFIGIKRAGSQRRRHSYAATEIERAFAVAASGRRRNDPRWKYDLVPEDKAAALLLEMRKAFGELSR